LTDEEKNESGLKYKSVPRKYSTGQAVSELDKKCQNGCGLLERYYRRRYRDV
jgi:hypothetical protein